MASKGSLRKSLRSVGRKRQRETDMRDGPRERKEDGNDRRYGKRESDGGTAKVEKIFANMRDERHGEAGREKRSRGKTRAVKCHRAILIYGGREIGGVKLRAESVSPETAKFLFELSSARLAIKKMYPVPLAHVFCLSTDRRSESGRRGKS